MSAPSMPILEIQITNLADKLSDGGRHPVVGYAWRNPRTGAHGTGVFRTDEQLEGTHICERPWGARKWTRYRSLIRKLQSHGCEVIEIYK